MADKQIILSFDDATLEQVQLKSAAQKRSLTGQLRWLLEAIPDDKELLMKIREGVNKKSKVSKNDNNSSKTKQHEIHGDVSKVFFKIPEEEFWSATEKAIKARMNLREFSILILLRWQAGELDDLLVGAETVKHIQRRANYSGGKRLAKE